MALRALIFAVFSFFPLAAFAACEDVSQSDVKLTPGACFTVDIRSGRFRFEWHLDEPSAGSIWELRASADEESTLHLSLLDSEGTPIAEYSSSGGVVSIPDVGLLAGRYNVQLHGRAQGPVELLRCLERGPLPDSTAFVESCYL